MMIMMKSFSPKFEKDYCPDLLSWKELSDLVNNRSLMTMDRFIVNLPEEYGKNLRWETDRWVTNRQSIPSHILKDIIERYVCYIKEMSRCNRKINDFAKSIEEEYNKPTDAHIYMCKNVEAVHPFGIHFDNSDNIIVQCEGETNFKVWDIIEDINQQSIGLDITDQPLLDVDMKPGDAIWIPCHHPHLATSSIPRMSVSFPFIREHEDEPIQNREWIQL